MTKYFKLGLIVIALLFVTSSLFTLFVPNKTNAVSGSDWKAGRIIDDAIFFNKNSMSIQQIQQFLDAKVPFCDRNRPSSNPSYQPPWTCLKEYQENTTTKENNIGRFNGDGSPYQVPGGKSAAQIIWEVGQQYGINPQVLIVMLQKEQSLITDNWPWKLQYDRAMGYACPDNGPNRTANCDSKYYGFYNQVDSAAWQFIKYIQAPDLYNFKAGVTRYIQYNPDPACGGGNVFLENAATAALYNYTPYQPNAGALVNLYGTTPTCGAYGNRNFWRMFNDWFGSSVISGFPLTRATSFNDNGDQRQWLVFGVSKIHISDPSLIEALGLNDLPLINYPGEYLGSIPSQAKPLTRIIRHEGSLNLYLADSGKRYYIPSISMLESWGYSVNDITDLPSYFGVSLPYASNLTITLRQQGDTRVMLNDGGIVRHITDPGVLESISGINSSVTSVSSSYFNTRQQGTQIASAIVSLQGESYILDYPHALKLTETKKALYPNWSNNTVSSKTINTYNSKSAPILIKDLNKPEVFLVDGGVRKHIVSPEILSSLQNSINDERAVYESLSGLATKIPLAASEIDDYFFVNNSETYIIDKGLYLIPSDLLQAYTNNRNTLMISSNLKALLKSQQTATRYIKAENSPKVYLLTNSSRIMEFARPEQLALWGGEGNVIEFSNNNINKFNKVGNVNLFVTNGLQKFILDYGRLRLVNDDIATKWGLSDPLVFTDGTLNGRQQLSESLQDRIKYGQFYSLVYEGIAYTTTDKDIANIWSIDNGLNLPELSVHELLKQNILGRLAKSNVPGDNRQFIVNDGKLYHASPESIKNLNVNNLELTKINPGASNGEITQWVGVVLNGNGKNYVIDNGIKRLLPDGVIADFWKLNNPNIKAVSDGFINIYTTGRPMERAIKGNQPEVYAAESGKKRWIRSPEVYNNQFAPYTNISDELLNLLQQGNDI